MRGGPAGPTRQSDFFLEARPPAAGFFACKEPREETTRASFLKEAAPECIRVSPGHLDPAAHHLPKPKVVAIQVLPEKPHVLPCPVQRLAFVGADAHIGPLLQVRRGDS